MKHFKFIQSKKSGQALMGLAVVALMLVAGCSKNEVNPAETSSLPWMGFTQGPGNDAPSGGHYNLNIIGVPKGKKADMTGNNGHRIFVPMGGNTKINLREGDFQVLDANGTDGTAAFQLPNPDPTNSGITSYSVYIRALGKPGGSASIVTCALDNQNVEYCSGEEVQLVRVSGKSSFTNVSKELLYIYAMIDGRLQRIPLFDDRFHDFFWSYDNNGLKLAQLRFYQESTIVP